MHRHPVCTYFSVVYRATEQKSQRPGKAVPKSVGRERFVVDIIIGSSFPGHVDVNLLDELRQLSTSRRLQGFSAFVDIPDKL